MGLISLGEEAKQISQLESLLLSQEVVETIEVHSIFIQIALRVFNLHLVFSCRFDGG